MPSPTVSVIIPAYGRPELLEKAVRSAIAQDLDRHLPPDARPPHDRRQIGGAFHRLAVEREHDRTRELRALGYVADE